MTAKWYTLKVQAGKEDMLLSKIRDVLKTMGLEEYVEELFVPTQKRIIVTKSGQKKTKIQRLLPGYMLIKAKLTDELIAALTSLEEVYGFLKSGNIIMPLSEEEVAKLKSIKQEDTIESVIDQLRVNDAVRITSGVFAGQVAKVSKVDKEKGRVEVLISMLGTEVPHILSAEEIEKL